MQLGFSCMLFLLFVWAFFLHCVVSHWTQTAAEAVKTNALKVRIVTPWN